jgi:hypothetical protein
MYLYRVRYEDTQGTGKYMVTNARVTVVEVGLGIRAEQSWWPSGGSRYL